MSSDDDLGHKALQISMIERVLARYKGEVKVCLISLPVAGSLAFEKIPGVINEGRVSIIVGFSNRPSEFVLTVVTDINPEQVQIIDPKELPVMSEESLRAAIAVLENSTERSQS